MGFGNSQQIKNLSQRRVENLTNWENSQHLVTLKPDPEVVEEGCADSTADLKGFVDASDNLRHCAPPNSKLNYHQSCFRHTHKHTQPRQNDC